MKISIKFQNLKTTIKLQNLKSTIKFENYHQILKFENRHKIPFFSRSNAVEVEHRNRRSGYQWVWISFRVRTYIRRKIGATYADLNRAALENGEFLDNLTSEGTIENPNDSEVVETTETETEITQADLSGSGNASANCDTNSNGTVGTCQCNAGFTRQSLK